MLATVLLQLDDMQQVDSKRRPHALSRLITFARSLMTGAAASLVDLGVLALLVGLLGLSDRAANVPALLAGGLIQFFGNRHFAFDAAAGSLKRQVTLFAITEVVALGLNGLMFDWVAQQAELSWLGAIGVRAVISFVVFVSWSYPVWRHVFRVPADRPA